MVAPTTMSADSVDYTQYHMLHIITGIMNGYNLNPAQVQAHFDYVNSLSPETINTKYNKEDWSQPQIMLSELSESSSDDHEEKTVETEEPLYVETRRDFCLALGNKKKICPSYSSCTEPSCGYFHIRPEFICPHVSRGSSFCEEDGCELIVIRACRKGKNCNAEKCSFRH